MFLNQGCPVRGIFFFLKAMHLYFNYKLRTKLLLLLGGKKDMLKCKQISLF